MNLGGSGFFFASVIVATYFAARKVGCNHQGPRLHRSDPSNIHNLDGKIYQNEQH